MSMAMDIPNVNELFLSSSSDYVSGIPLYLTSMTRITRRSFKVCALPVDLYVQLPTHTTIISDMELSAISASLPKEAQILPIFGSLDLANLTQFSAETPTYVI